MSDATAIRAHLDPAAEQILGVANPAEVACVDDRGASTAGVYIAVIEGGKAFSKTTRDFK
ncbi:hypothetical protein [Variovorax sp. 770b2]|uniref:hypothetical protein n=1 Tax=Variovorax sp. 770b2 TaxID=1566271 RepID=UPI001160645C|nr:hypothetical protein [Variovorax sp. 770b2]